MRTHHSVSSVNLGRRCQRAWAYRYVAGLREPELTWEAIESGSAKPVRGQRAQALGKAVHAIGEQHYTLDGSLGAPNWASLPGEIFATGIGHLPPANSCSLIETEREIGAEPVPGDPIKPGPRTGHRLEKDGVLWVGYRDLLVCHGGDLLQVDYKTTDLSGARKHDRLLTTETLARDLQCALYSHELCERFGLNGAVSMWLYLDTKVRRSHPVRAIVSRQQAADIIGPAAEFARVLDRIESSDTAEPNPESCWDFGGCYLARANGGPCPHQRTKQKVSISMSIDPTTAARFRALKAASVAPAPPVTPAQALPPSAMDGVAAPPVQASLTPPPVQASLTPPPVQAPITPPPPSDPSPTPAEPKKRTRKRASVTAPVTPPSKQPDWEDYTERLIAAAAAVAEAKRAFDSAVAELQAVARESAQ